MSKKLTYNDTDIEETSEEYKNNNVGLIILSWVVISLLFLFIVLAYLDSITKNIGNKDKTPKKNKAELIKNIMYEIEKKINIEIDKIISNIDSSYDDIKVGQIDNRINVKITTTMRDESNANVMNNVEILMNFILPNLEKASEYDLEYILYKKDKDFIFKLLLLEYGYDEIIYYQNVNPQ